MNPTTDLPPQPQPSPTADHITAIMSAAYFAVSEDGCVKAVATGDQRLQSVEFGDWEDADIADVTHSVTQAVRDALTTAQQHTVAALQEVPGFGDLIPWEDSDRG